MLTRQQRAPICQAGLYLLVAVVFVHGAPKSDVDSEKNGILSHELSGRPLKLMHGTVRLHRVSEGSSIRSQSHNGNGHPLAGAGAAQYLVRAGHSSFNSKLMEELRALANGRHVRYLPHDSFLATLDQDAVKTAQNLEGVEGVFHVPREMKTDPKLARTVEYVSARAVSKEESKKAMELWAFLSEGGPSWDEEEQQLLTEWGKALQDPGVGGDGLQVQLASTGVLSILTDANHLSRVVDWLAEQPLLSDLMERPQPHFNGIYANKLLQSTDASNTPIWAKGIDGTGQVVSVADSGLDYDSCFFRDDTQAVSTCSGTGVKSGCFNYDHRKVISYRTLDGAVYSDKNQGHGTGVAGCLVGSNLDSNANGAAPGAKIVIDDIDVDNQGSFYLPPNIRLNLFPHSYYGGARIQSNSWSVHGENRYHIYAQEVDRYSNTRDDYLIFVAAGNAGPDPGTTEDPATAKNIISVGGSENSRQYYFDANPVNNDRDPEWMMVRSGPNSVVGNAYRLVPAKFGIRVNGVAGDFRGELAVGVNEKGCTAIETVAPVTPGAYAGKVVMLWRGTCYYEYKLMHAINGGAVALVIVNTGSCDTQSVFALRAGVTDPDMIPAFCMSSTDGANFKTLINNGNTIEVVLPQETADLMWADSSRGPTSDHRYKPDVLCPSHRVNTALSDGNTDTNQCQSYSDVSPTGLDLAYSGTSFGAPKCAGAATLVRQYLTEGWHVNGTKNTAVGVSSPSSALMKAFLINSARPGLYTDSDYKYRFPDTFPNPDMGHGRVDLSQVLSFGQAESGFVTKLHDRVSLSTSEVQHYCFDVDDIAHGTLRITLVWNDPYSSQHASRTLVNDLDLVVVGPSGQEYYGNNYVATNDQQQSVPARESWDNSERVTIHSPVVGHYSVRVIGTDIPDGPQLFALVMSGAGSELAASQCEDTSCFNGCSGHGTCVNSLCECAGSHSGQVCQLENVVLENGVAHAASVSARGTAYYQFHVPNAGMSWSLSLVHSSGADADYRLAYNRVPTLYDYDYSSSGSASWSSAASGAGYWVLSVGSNFDPVSSTVTVSITGNDIPTTTDAPTTPEATTSAAPTTPPATTPAPDPLAPQAGVENCVMDMSWAEITRVEVEEESLAVTDKTVRAAGLGLLTVPGKYEVYVCSYGHACATGGDPMCFIFNEAESRFEPWGLGLSQLKLYDAVEDDQLL
mmetsp:Transcript_16207/g.32441  ORF Transcript_16207/g.32441 Transcript_16207/m.32441 type:complete len:1193 (-) Transcript_16207:247-3825(-)|eukprot:CAMPEP_0181305972 /NCGR_PEP_ID=MMETSP1101-20121128/10036_1 /TAXON_ID=46948 /ORGANISM="Rhodomonas abbreviata, Strain Caron Lab Isolate" /LENGTH=1192 /DNA_ID=CAMNT_0023411967 /DNA_START=153 /DNA_END=3731 /DNA_ORIENTATION=-